MRSSSGITVSTVPPVVLNDLDHGDLQHGISAGVSMVPVRPSYPPDLQSEFRVQDKDYLRDIEVGVSAQLLNSSAVTNPYSVPSWPYYYNGGHAIGPFNAATAPFY